MSGLIRILSPAQSAHKAQALRKNEEWKAMMDAFENDYLQNMHRDMVEVYNLDLMEWERAMGNLTGMVSHHIGCIFSLLTLTLDL